MDAILKEFSNIWLTLRAMNFYLEITVSAFGLYFWGRVSKMDNRIAVLLPIVACLLGQIAYGMQHAAEVKQPFDLDDWIMSLFWTLLQAGISFMAYSIAEKYGIIDKLMQKFIREKNLDPDAAKPNGQAGYANIVLMIMIVVALAFVLMNTACIPLRWRG